MAISRCLAVSFIASLANEIDAYTYMWDAQIYDYNDKTWKTLTWGEAIPYPPYYDHYVRGKRIYSTKEQLGRNVNSFQKFFENALRDKHLDEHLKHHIGCVQEYLKKCKKRGIYCRFRSQATTSSYNKGYVGQRASTATWIPYEPPNTKNYLKEWKKDHEQLLGESREFKWSKNRGTCSGKACDLERKYDGEDTFTYFEWDRTLRSGSANAEIILVPKGRPVLEDCINIQPRLRIECSEEEIFIENKQYKTVYIHRRESRIRKDAQRYIGMSYRPDRPDDIPLNVGVYYPNKKFIWYDPVDSANFDEKKGCEIRWT